MRLVGLVAIAVLGTLGPATVVRGQTLPLPTLPGEPVAVDPASSGEAPAGGADALGSAASSRPQPWDYGLGVGVGWDSNIDFLVPDGPSSWGVTPRGNLARTFWSSRGQLRVGGSGSWTGYQDARDLDRYDVTFSLDGSYRSSLSTTWRASGGYGIGYGDSSWILSDQGVLLPRVQTQSLSAGAGVTRQMGMRTSFRLDGRAYRTVFDENDGAALGLVDGQSFRGTAGLERKLGQRDTAAIEYSLEGTLGRVADAVEGERSYGLTHYGSLQWTHVLSQRSGLLLEAGASYTPEADEAGLGRPASFYGGASYRREIRRSSVVLFARREVLPVFGLGVSRVENRFGASLAIPMGRAWRFALNGTHARPETPEESELSYGNTVDVSGSLARRLGRRFELSAEGRYRRRGPDGTFPEIDAFQVGLFVSLVRP